MFLLHKCIAVYVCPYLDDSIKSWDSVDLSSLCDQLALNFIPHCLDSMGVWANECYTLCRLSTKQQQQHIYLMTYNNTRKSKELKFHPTAAGLAPLASQHTVCLHVVFLLFTFLRRLNIILGFIIHVLVITIVITSKIWAWSFKTIVYLLSFREWDEKININLMSVCYVRNKQGCINFYFSIK